MLPKNQEAHDFDLTIHRILDLSIDLLTRLLTSLLALPLGFWLGLAADHRSHTPTTHPPQYIPGLRYGLSWLCKRGELYSC